MTLQLDPDIAAALAAAAQDAPDLAPPERGDVTALRETTNATLTALFSGLPPASDVETAEFQTDADDGTAVGLRWYTKTGETPGSAIVYAHGGGMICGSAEIYEPMVKHYVQATGVPFLSVDYRLAPEFPGTVPSGDVLAAIAWLFDRAESLGVDATRIALMGDSGGGGVGAGAAILARDNNLRLNRQILIYPMLDDRNTVPDPALAPTATWTYDNNYTGWHALLGDAIGGPEVPPAAAPARLQDMSGLAPAFIEVGELDIFRDESIDYAQRLLQAGVSCELHVIAGAPHAHDMLGMAFDIGQRSIAERVRVVRSI